ncbi:Substance-K receptor [Trichoplax sp. H2]|nr:Substance-K receptor [Trichoplax sp. H2]|eukprot:RDD37915.1 Substance-K receptor [Trichoplax sp. H2]
MNNSERNPITDYFKDISPLAMQLVAYIPSAIILSLGIITNITILVSLIKKGLHNVRDLFFYLVTSLVIYDIVLLVLYWPLALVRKSIPWPFGSFLCYFFNLLPVLCNAGPSLTVVAMAIHQYRVIVKSANPSPSTTRKRIILAAIFFTALAATFPDLVFTAYTYAYGLFIGPVAYYDDAVRVCFVYIGRHYSNFQDPYHIYCISLYVTLYVIPLIIVVILYYQIKRNIKIDDTATNSAITVTYGDITIHKKWAKMTLILMITLLLFWTPEYIFYFVYNFGYLRYSLGYYRRYQITYLICQLITVSKCIANPVIYAHFFPECKQSLRSIFTCSYIKRKSDQPDMINLSLSENKI